QENSPRFPALLMRQNKASKCRDRKEMYRVWILHCQPWEPRNPADIPPRGIVLELAEKELFTGDEARDYVEGFNISPERPHSVWVIRIAVRWQTERQVIPGAVIRFNAAGEPVPAPRSRCAAR